MPSLELQFNLPGVTYLDGECGTPPPDYPGQFFVAPENWLPGSGSWNRIRQGRSRCLVRQAPEKRTSWISSNGNFKGEILKPLLCAKMRRNSDRPSLRPWQIGATAHSEKRGRGRAL